MHSSDSSERPHSSLQPEDPEQWLADYGDNLFRFAFLRLRNVHLAEDLVQETFVKAFRAYDTFRQEASVQTWLFRILRNEIAAYLRSASTRRVVAEESGEAPSMSELLCPEMSANQFRSATERDEFWQMVQQCFDRVPEHLLETFLSRLANPEQSVGQLSSQLEISDSNFHVRLFRTRLLLRKCVESNWIEA